MRRSSNLRRLLVAMLGMVTLTAVACGSGEDSSAPKQRQPGEKITLTFWSCRATACR